MFRQNAYYPFRAVKDRPYLDEFRALPSEQRRWDALAQLALFRTRDAFGEKDVTRDDPEASACAMNEAKLADQLARFFDSGQALFHIAGPLRDAFRTSDLGDACVDDIKFPFPYLFVHLGRDLGLTFNDGRALLEGAFLERRDKDTTLSVTLVGELVEPPAHWGQRGMESFHFYLNDSTDNGSERVLKKPLLQAIEERLLSQAQDPNDVKELSDWSEFTEEQKADIQRSWAAHSLERELHMKNLQVTKDCMQLVANALLYLSQYPEDVEEVWQEGTPKGYQEKFERQDPKARAKTLSRAEHEGFTRIRKVGKLFEVEQAWEQGESPLPHLRRAHWRRQAYGPKQSLRRLVWIRAARVLGGTVRERPYLLADPPETSPSSQLTT